MSDAILLVDDEASVLSSITRALRGEQYEVISELSGELALQLMKKRAFKVVVSDERMLQMQGSEFLGIIRKRYPGTVRILLTGHATIEAAMRAVNEGGIYKFLTKPWNDSDLKQIIRDAIEKHDAEQEAWRIFARLNSERDELGLLEDDFPGISRLERDSTGKLALPDLSEEEIEQLRVDCEQAFMNQPDEFAATGHLCGLLVQKFGGEKR